MATRKISYGTRTAMTIALASLASDANLLVGVESDAVDNGTDLAIDHILDGKITTGTSPTASKEIRVYVAASWDGTAWPDAFDGTGSAETITSSDIRNDAIKLAKVLGTDGTSNRSYYFDGVSVAQLYGGRMPRKYVVFVTHSTGVSLNATAGNHAIAYTPIYETVA